MADEQVVVTQDDIDAFGRVYRLAWRRFPDWHRQVMAPFAEHWSNSGAASDYDYIEFDSGIDGVIEFRGRDSSGDGLYSSLPISVLLMTDEEFAAYLPEAAAEAAVAQQRRQEAARKARVERENERKRQAMAERERIFREEAAARGIVVAP